MVSYRACATSAMRNASNGEELVEKIAEEAGIAIEIIPGKKEADIIFSNPFEEHLLQTGATSTLMLAEVVLS